MSITLFFFFFFDRWRNIEHIMCPTNLTHTRGSIRQISTEGENAPREFRNKTWSLGKWNMMRRAKCQSNCLEKTTDMGWVPPPLGHRQAERLLQVWATLSLPQTCDLLFWAKTREENLEITENGNVVYKAIAANGAASTRQAMHNVWFGVGWESVFGTYARLSDPHFGKQLTLNKHYDGFLPAATIKFPAFW